ncbi:MAG TPA: HAMP domain-containing sensor histidine kinase [Clostridia bacterium]|nr:HAMP domain-containing sensor histidine kinase [Clostridia bacterium]
MKKKFNNLNSKLVLNFVFFAVAILVVIWFMQAILLKTTYEFIRKYEINNVSYKAEKIYTDSEELNEIAYKNDVRILILDSNFNTIVSTDNNIQDLPRSFVLQISQTLEELKYEEKINKDISTNKFDTVLNINARSIDGNKYIAIISTISPVSSTVRVLTIQLVYITILSLVFAIILAIILSKKLSKPIHDINEKAKEFEKGNFDIYFNQDYYKEINELSKTLNKASEKLKKTDKLRKEVIANVSHDLKTPLATIKGYSEMLQDISGEDKEKRNIQLKKISREVDNLNLLVSDMLNLSKLETVENELEKSEIDLITLIKDVIYRFDHICEKTNTKIQFKTYTQNKIIQADEIKISQVIYNLIANAISFVGKDKTVYVEVLLINNKTRVEVRDNGKGISLKDQKHIFERYYKTNDKFRKLGISTGLGLSIVKNILEKHNFEYGVISKENCGTNFWFQI